MPTKRQRHPTHHPPPLARTVATVDTRCHGCRPRKPTRTVRAARRPTHRRSRGRPHPGHLLVRQATAPRQPPRRPPRAARLGRLAHPAGPLRPARPHRSRERAAAVSARRRSGPLAQHGQPRAAPPRGPRPDLPPRFRDGPLAWQDPAAVRPHRPRLQRPAPATRGASRPRSAGDTQVVRCRQGDARPPAQTARLRLHDAVRHRSSPATATQAAASPCFRRRLVGLGRRRLRRRG